MSERLFRSTIPAAFLLSGLAGLVYEVVWSKYLTLFIGGTALAHTIVLATFMGGLAAGNAVFGRVADRPAVNCLRVYALLELGVGLCCLLFPVLFARLAAVYVALGGWAGPTSALNPWLKAALSVVSLFLPCFFMGGTLPLLMRFITESVAGLGVRLGWLYFINTAGAVFGCLLGGFYLIEAWGLELAMVATSLVNLAIGGVFYLLSRQAPPRAASSPPAPDGLPAAEEGIQYTWRQSRVALGCITAAGALTMLYEIVWFRLLVLSMGGTVHSFSTMLAGFVAGIAAGGGLAAWLMRAPAPRNALALFGLCELAIGLCTLLPFALFERLPYAFFRVGSGLVHTPENYGVYQAAIILFAMTLMGIPALLMGAALPLAGRVQVARLEGLGRGVGNAFSANTVGNVLGAVLVGLLVMPALGLERTLLLGGVASGVLGVVILWAWRPQGPDAYPRALRAALAPHPEPVGPRLWPAALLLILAAGLWRGLGGPFWDPRLLQAGLYRWEVAASPPSSWPDLRQQRERVTSLYSRDGADASLLVEEWPAVRGAQATRVVRVNGKPDAGSGADMPTQIFVGHLAAFFHPSPRTAMVVGLGSGATAAAVLRHEGLRVDVAEISPEMVEAARHFTAVNDDVLANPRLSLAVVDAREWLRLGRRRYDVVVSEPTNVWVPGVANLFTRDFYQTVRSSLNPGGVFTQWLQGYALDGNMFDSALASMRDVFPVVSVWSASDSDLVFLASDHRPALDVAGMERRFAQVRPATGLSDEPGLEMMGDPVTFLANQLATPEAIALYWPKGWARPYRDLFPAMEFAAARMQFRGRGYRLLDEVDERRLPLVRESLYVEDYLRQRPLDAARRGALANRLLRASRSLRTLGEAVVMEQLASTEGGASAAERTYGRAPASEGAWLLARALEGALRTERSSGACEAYLRFADQSLAAGASVLTRPSTDAFEREMDACVAAHPERAGEWRARMVLVLSGAWAPERALARFSQLEADGVVARLNPHAQAALLREAAHLLLRLGRTQEALGFLQRSLAQEPTADARRLALGIATSAGRAPGDPAGPVLP